MTSLEKAEHLVRNHKANKELMDLGKGCLINLTRYRDSEKIFEIIHVIDSPEESGFNDKMILHRVAPKPLKSSEVYMNVTEDAVILGKPPQLQHYLRVLVEESKPPFCKLEVSRKDAELYYGRIAFNFTTGAPATEKDAEEFIKLVS